MLRRFYDWLLLQAGKKNATWVMAGISFAESSFFPLPPDVLMIPMCLANRRRAFWYATVATVSSVLGAYLGYAIGYYLFASVGEQILRFYGAMDTFEALREKFLRYGVEIIVLKGMTAASPSSIWVCSRWPAWYRAASAFSWSRPSYISSASRRASSSKSA